MKNIYTKTKAKMRLCTWRIVGLFVFLSSMGLQTAKAQYTAIPDVNFEQALFDQGIDTVNGDHRVLTSAISGLTQLEVNSKNILSLEGIQGFTSLTALNCSNNSLSILNLSANTALGILTCAHNTLSSLNLSANTALYTLSCSGNSLSNLDVSANTGLLTLDCSYNSLSSLNLNANIALAILFCDGNSLSNLDVSANTALYTLFCGNNSLSNLNLSANTVLYNLSCPSNSLSSLNLSANTALGGLNCNSNTLTSLNLSANTALLGLDCSYNSLSTLNLIANTALISLSCLNNSLSSLNLSGISNLQYFACNNNPSLSCITVSDVADANTKTANGLWNKDASASYSTYCGAVNPTSKVRASQCGVTLNALNTNIIADVIPGAQMSRFEVTKGANVRTYDTTKYNFDLTKIAGTTYGTTYSIKVAVKIGGNWGAYGTSCNISTPALTASIIPVTKLRASQCGSTLTAIGSPIHSELVYGAEAYRFQLTNGATVTEVESPIYYFFLTNTNIGTYGTTFSIKTRAKIDGVWGNYGTACAISTPALVANTVPLTQVSPSFCNTTLGTLATKIPATIVYNAGGYRFEITKGTTVTVYDSAFYNFKLSDAGIVATNGTTYTIRVAAKVNGVYGNYGASCNVTTPSNASNSRAIIGNKTFSIVAFPNPSNSDFKLQFNGANEDAVSILVFDMTGRQIENKEVNASDIENITIGQNYSTGIYNVIVSQGNKTKTVRLVKQ